MAKGCVCDRYGGKTAAEVAAGKPTCSERIAELEELLDELIGSWDYDGDLTRDEIDRARRVRGEL